MFSKYDVYTTVQSVYCYPDTDVLINKLNIRDKAELKQAEEEFTAVKQMALLQEPIKGRFTKTHLFRIHRFLFEDVYPFAGHIRKEQISKGDTMFYPPDLIDRELERVFKNIHSKKLLAERDEEKQIQNLSQTMAELNIIHPFRDGKVTLRSSLSRFLTRSFDDSAEKFFTYTKLGLPKPLRFRSIKPNSSSYRSSLVALLSAQHNALLTSSIVKMMNTRPCSSSQPFLADRLMRSSRMP